MRMYKSLISFLWMTLLISGCCGVSNVRTDRHEMFVEIMNDKIGKPSPFVRDFYQKSLGTPFEYEITDYKGVLVYKSKESLKGVCATHLLISVETNIVVGWDYIAGSDFQKCVAPPRNCAW